MATMDDAPRVPAETRSQWQEWLTSHHRTAESAWLVSWKKATGKPAVSYDDAVSEALAVGWVDSRPRALDDERTMLYFSPRKPRSAWSRPNKIRVEALRQSGLMLPAGEQAVATAVANGSWTVLDDVENLVVPEDLSDAFDIHVGSRAKWENFPRSARRGILEWIMTAKRPDTRAKRIDETARRASIGERAAQWQPRGRDAGTPSE